MKMPTRLGRVCEVLEEIAPLQLAQDWDNVGLLAGDRRSTVKRMLLCIDMMPAVVDEAVRKRVDLVVSYHPPIFRPITRLTAPTSRMEAGVLRCLQNRVAIYSPHTALDCTSGGTNDVLAALCDVVAPAPLEPLPHDESVGIGRVGSLKAPITLEKLARKLKRRANAGCVSLVGDPTRELRRAIVAVGAAGSLPFGLDLTKRDVIVTGEMRHHDALQVRRRGCSAIALSHWSSERPTLAALAAEIEQRLPGMKTLLSAKDCEPFTRV